ncbi:phage tail tube protein [Paenibacillus sp. GCM10012307]|uniref:Phage tail tube protein n=1 Tax=Paenibacillus roseus TaxID=2798579 RepID=A0A934J3D2_9BACL|nr:phage tail tube protein [Paenibacillus roseus]MBJ6360874.1 phage tail tube protein [Paenibacillus roseus]
MPFLNARDSISGQEGRAYAKVDGVVEELFYIKTLEATVEKEKAEIKTLGRRGTQHKAVGWSGSGSMTIYYVTSYFRKMMYTYIKTGKDVYFEISVTNEDPTSTIGAQTVVLKGCNLDSVIVAKLDTESDALDEEVSFTFDDLEIPEQFKAPSAN